MQGNLNNIIFDPETATEEELKVIEEQKLNNERVN
jgi:hypothetical protein